MRVLTVPPVVELKSGTPPKYMNTAKGTQTGQLTVRLQNLGRYCFKSQYTELGNLQTALWMLLSPIVVDNLHGVFHVLFQPLVVLMHLMPP